jgi:hypothetical protein
MDTPAWIRKKTQHKYDLKYHRNRVLLKSLEYGISSSHCTLLQTAISEEQAVLQPPVLVLVHYGGNTTGIVFLP